MDQIGSMINPSFVFRRTSKEREFWFFHLQLAVNLCVSFVWTFSFRFGWSDTDSDQTDKHDKARKGTLTEEERDFSNSSKASSVCRWNGDTDQSEDHNQAWKEWFHRDKDTLLLCDFASVIGRQIVHNLLTFLSTYFTPAIILRQTYVSRPLLINISSNKNGCPIRSSFYVQIANSWKKNKFSFLIFSKRILILNFSFKKNLLTILPLVILSHLFVDHGFAFSIGHANPSRLHRP